MAQEFPPHHFSPHESMNYSGRKMPRNKDFFSIIGVKLDGAGDFLVFSIYFNDALDASSIHSRQIFIDDVQLPPQTEFLFSRNRRMMRFEIKKIGLNENFALKIMGAKSFDGKILRATEIKSLTMNSFFKYNRMEKQWQKF